MSVFTLPAIQPPPLYIFFFPIIFSLKNIILYSSIYYTFSLSIPYGHHAYWSTSLGVFSSLPNFLFYSKFCNFLPQDKCINLQDSTTIQGTVLWKLKKPKKNSPESSFRILSLWQPTESPWSKIKNFYALGCVIFCDLPNSMA